MYNNTTDVPCVQTAIVTVPKELAQQNEGI